MGHYSLKVSNIPKRKILQKNYSNASKTAFGSEKNRIMGIRGGERFLTICLAVIAQYRHLTNRQTGGITVQISCCALVNECGRVTINFSSRNAIMYLVTYSLAYFLT